MFPHHTKVAIYVSVGTPDEGEDSQMAELHQYAVGMGWTVLEYRERRGRAGTRPALGQLMYRLRQSRIDVVLVKSADCFARSLAELAENVARLYRENIRFLALGESIDINPRTEAGRRFFQDLTVLAKVERTMMTRNVRAGVAQAQSEGVHCGRPRRPFPRVEARKLRAQGLSIRAVAAQLGVPASTVADALQVPRLEGTLKGEEFTGDD
jgi:putative DNA-invertase from lambdoid prophage Rac